MAAFANILRCADEIYYYVGSAGGESLDRRRGEHDAGTCPRSTSHRRPVILVYDASFEWITDAVAFERVLKGWGRAMKEAFIASDWDASQRLPRRPRDAEISDPPTSG